MSPGLPEMRRGDHGSGEGSYPEKASLPLLEGTARKALPWPMGPAAKRPAPGKKARKVSLSLDVPTQVLKILLDLAREKELQAKAAANAELMGRPGAREHGTRLLSQGWRGQQGCQGTWEEGSTGWHRYARGDCRYSTLFP
ncbi:PREDICTED: urocortin-3 [Merops nubicus]|uniref:urocortin-3 n=1 Tax=Merops nubicus TaxID=57421 RepID=UPI0004F07BD1|nr:PREDICTED: urocortin-3 [Merops nubicus]